MHLARRGNRWLFEASELANACIIELRLIPGAQLIWSPVCVGMTLA